MTDLYVEWASELVDLALEKIYDPYLASHKDDVAKAMAVKLKDDLEKWLVWEWFCSDCDYKRRCE
jgi:hypothetical protein